MTPVLSQLKPLINPEQTYARMGVSASSSRRLVIKNQSKKFMVLKLIINYPGTLPNAVSKTKEQFEQEAKWAMVVKLYEMKRLSSGIAANLL